MAKVLFLKPSAMRDHDGALVPPMGIMYLAAVLRERGGHAIRLLDTRLSRNWEKELVSCLQDFQPDVVGISALTLEIPSAIALIQAVRAWSPSVPVMVGGPHATACPEGSLALFQADAIVVGEGEEIIDPLVSALASRELPTLPGVLTRAEDPFGGMISSAPVPDLDSLPFPAWDLIDLDAYGRRHSMCSLSPWRYATLVTSRGCPWRCTYCHGIHGKRLRVRSLDSVAAELDLLKARLGSGAIELLDDNFNAIPERGKQILELFCQRSDQIQPVFANGVRSDRVDEEMLDLLARAGTRFMSFAIESADPKIQEAIKKRLDLDAARRAIEGAASRGLYTNGFFMLGFPGETRSQILKTLRFSRSVPLVQALFFRVLPMPGSALGEQYGSLESAQSDHIDDYYTSNVNLSAVSDAELAMLLRVAYLGFYGRPKQIKTVLRAMPDLSILPERTRSLALVLLSQGRTTRLKSSR
jgi:radical SAM superfamily enzyme YgiQ (UPF0313 family)